MAVPLESRSQIWRRIEEGEALEKDIPSLPSLPHIDMTGMDDSFQEPSRSSFSIAALNRSLPRPTRSPSNSASSSSSPRSHHSQQPNNSVHVVEEEYDLSISMPSDEIIDNDGEMETLKLSNKSQSLRRERTTPELEFEDAVETEKSDHEGGGSPSSPAFIDVSTGSAQQVYESFAETLPSLDLKNVVTRRNTDHSRPAGLNRSVSSLASSSSSSDARRSTKQKLAEASTDHMRRSLSSSRSSGIAISEGISQSQIQPDTANVESDPREPTFSSSEGGSQVAGESAEEDHAPEFSTPKPGPSTARLQTTDLEMQQPDQDTLSTPLPRKRAFLMGVINSSTRPRQRFQTPYNQKTLPGPSFADNIGPHTPLFKTPIPSRGFGRRLSHPLAQAHTFEPLTPSDAQSQDANGVHASPGDASFVSTTSSQDLTLQRRANASFDPLMGQELYNRFDVQKLNNYQQGLIRQLQEEAASLLDQVRYLEEQNIALRADHGESSQGGTHVRGDLSEVREEQDAEAWSAEKVWLENVIQQLENQNDAVQKQLEKEQEERSRDKARWKEKMTEVEQGVGDIVGDLENRLNAAEAKAARLAECEEKLRESEEGLAIAMAEKQEWRAKAESADSELMEKGKVEMTSMESLRKENSQLTHRIDTLTVTLEQREKRINSLESSLEAERKDAATRRAQEKESLDSVRGKLAEANAGAARLRDELQDVERERSQAVISAQRAEERVKTLEESVTRLQDELVNGEDSLDVMKQRHDSLEHDIRLARDEIKELEQALESADNKLAANALEIADLRTKLESQVEAKSMTTGLNGNITVRDGVEEELDAANKEIGRLNTLLNQSPARKAIEKAKDARIDMLEKQNEDLVHQIARLEESRNDRDVGTTPRKVVNMSGISPMHRHLLSMTMKTPQALKEALTDPSWLYDKTGEFSPAPLLAEISKLQRELDVANESIDDKLDKLEEAGLGVAGLTKALDEARNKIASLEVQLTQLRSEGNGRGACPKCTSKARLGVSGDEVFARVKELTSELEQLRRRQESDKLSLQGENAVLKDATHRLNSEIAATKRELKSAVEQGRSAERSKAELQRALTTANGMVQELERALEVDRNLLKSMKVEHSQATRDRDKIIAKLRKTELEVDEAKDLLQQLKSENSKLTVALRDQDDAQVLEEKLAANRSLIDRLRTERSDLSSERFQLQEQLAEASKHVNKLNSEQAKLQASYSGRRKQIDVQATEMENLRTALSTQGSLLDKAVTARDRAEIESKDVQAVIRSLEADLKRVQRDADRFGEDLKRLRQQKNEMETRYNEERAQHEKSSKQNRSQIRVLREQLETQKQLQHTHGDQTMNDLMLTHKKECKGLFVQIRYLKAKFTREASLRSDLGYQKQYLLIVLSQYETSEKRILATLAKVNPPMREKRKFKSLRVYGMLVIFLLRARRAGEIWREQRSSKEAIQQALEHVRKRREKPTS